VTAWDTATGKTRFTRKAPASQVAFSRDGGRLFSIDNRHIKAWDATTRDEPITLTCSGERWGLGLAFNGDATRFAAFGLHLGSGRTVKVWNSTGQELFTVEQPFAEKVQSYATYPRVALSPDGKRVASQWIASLLGDQKERRCGGIHVWDVATGRELLRLEADKDTQFWSLAFSPDGARVSSAVTRRAGKDDGNVLKIWDVVTGKELLSIPASGYQGVPLVFSPDGTRLAAVVLVRDTQNQLRFRHEVQVWDAATGEERLRLELPAGASAQAGCLTFSPDGKRLSLAMTHGEISEGRVWDADTGKQLSTLKAYARTWTLAFSPDGRRIVGAVTTRTGPGSELQVWDADTGQELLALKGHTGMVLAVGFSPDGQRIWSAGHSAAANTNDAGTAESYRTIEVRVWDGRPLAESLPPAGGPGALGPGR
jgi:WD40 repeat protein